MSRMENEVLILESNNDAAVWPPKHEEIFIELMEEEVIKGNRITTTFTKQSWKYIREELCSRAKKIYSDTQIRNKYNILKQKHKDFKSLLKETGMGYNAETGQVNATDEVWDRLIRVNKSAKKFKKKGCLFYEKLCIIYGDTTATGSNAHPSNRSPSHDDDDDNDGNDDDDDDDAVSKSANKNQENNLDGDGWKRKSNSSSRSEKRGNFSSSLSQVLETYNENAKRKVDLLERSMMSSLSHYLLDESVEALDAIPGISGEVYAKAIEKFESEVSRALFLKMPQHRRIDWLLNLK